MRSHVLLLTVGLFAVDSALAGPCKPGASSSDAPTTTSMDSMTQPTTIGSASTASAIETTVTEMTTAGITSAEVATTEIEATTTTTAPIATPTFNIVGGGGSVNGSPLQGISQDGSLLVFDPQFQGPQTRSFILDPDSGRLRDKDTGTLACAYYGFSDSPSVPPRFAFCQNGNTGPNRYYDYFTCEVNSGKLA
ncbi:hypothetical protein FHETE_11404, partial [Fusarium heterosporum]